MQTVYYTYINNNIILDFVILKWDYPDDNNLHLCSANFLCVLFPATDFLKLKTFDHHPNSNKIIGYSTPLYLSGSQF